MQNRSSSSRRTAIVVFWALIALLSTSVASARELFWPRLEVEARLDADGKLHIVERQTMRFDGIWNGGNRRFSVRPFQKLKLQGVTRTDPDTGETVTLRKGELEKVDRYDWGDNKTLFWRSRLPTDPAFDQKTLIYELTYTLSRVLVKRGDVYVLDHDFAFSDRLGRIDSFILDLEIDPAWQATTPLPNLVERGPLPPGQGVWVNGELAYTGAGRPSAAVHPTSSWVGHGYFVAALAAIVTLFLGLGRHGRSRGRFDRVEIPAQPDRAWLEAHLFDLRPEEVGALWDRRVGPPEVAAVIARLVAEGKLESSVSGKGRKRVLSLRRIADPGTLEGYERKLVDKLFFDGRTETDTTAIKKHYKKKGFDPAGIISPRITKRLQAMAGVGDKIKPPTDRLPLWLMLGLVVLVGVECLLRGAGGLQIAGMLLAFGLLPMLVGFTCAAFYRTKTRHLIPLALGMAVPAVILVLALWVVTVFLSMVDFFPTPFGLAALALFPVFLTSLWVLIARTHESPQSMARRHELGAIRRWLRNELDKEHPAIDDTWLPYLLAFGLDRQVDRWFKVHGATGGGLISSHRTSSSSTTIGSSTPSWTGGGGTFGGAGATAAWATAAAGMAAGVAAPSSSSSSGGGGGSFSGGGGGGGW